MRSTIIGKSKGLIQPYLADSIMSLSGSNYNSSTNVWADNNSNNPSAYLETGYTAPTFNSSDSNFNNLPTVQFGGNSILYRTAGSTDLAQNTQKFLLMLFESPTNTNTAQITFEVGNTNYGFGFNIYSNTAWQGVWNTTQRRWLSSAIAANTKYLVTIEYNGTKFRQSLNGMCSSSMLFSGFGSMTGNAGIGASDSTSRTNLTTTTDHQQIVTSGFKIAEMIVMNNCDQTKREAIIQYIDLKYGTSYYANYTGYFG